MILCEIKKFQIAKNEENFFAPKTNSKGNLECIPIEGQNSKESTSARYLFLCLKLASNEVSRPHDT